MTVLEEEATANYVPAAAVIRRWQALSGIIGRKGSAGGNISYTNPVRAKKYRGGEDVWYVADYVKDDHSVHGKEGDALPHIWVDVSKAIEMIKKGPASKYNEARLAALTKVKKLNGSNSNTVLLATEGYKKLKLSDW